MPDKKKPTKSLVTKKIRNKPGTTIPPHIHQQAFVEYMMTDRQLQEIAEGLGLSFHTLVSWSKREKWPALKRDKIQGMITSVGADYHELMTKNKIKVLKRHLEASEKIEEKIIDAVPEIPAGDTRKLLDVSKALKCSADVSSRAVGIGEEGSGPGNLDTPLISVNLTMDNVKPATEKEEREYMDAEFTEEQDGEDKVQAEVSGPDK